DGVEFFLRHGILGPRWNRAASAGQREPESLDVAAGKYHGGVESDDRELPCDVKNGLDDVLADFGFGVVELRGIVPSETRAIVAVIDIAGGSVAVVAQAGGNGSIGLVVIVVF